MKYNQTYRYEDNPAKRLKNAHPDSPQQLEPYVVADDLKRAVNLALFLRRPLLLEGESGCGKTRLAYAVAYELGLPLYRWPVTSNSKTQEGLYTYNAILRLHDVHTKEKKHRNPENPQDYLELGPLGKAFAQTDHPGVVLIDEIDKADIDFPNDLLTILDDPWSFPIVETNETITATHKPILFITSNKEKGNLPAPFLRRCIYHFIKFPDDEGLLKQIVAAHYQKREDAPPPDALTQQAVTRFLDIRDETGLHKKPGTSEFLDWLHVLNAFEGKPFAGKMLGQKLAVPYRELLFKLRADWLRYT